MDFQNILVEYKGRICFISFNRPKALNALNTDTLKELDTVLTELYSREDIAIVVFTGVGKAFVAGADIQEMVDMDEDKARKYGEFGSTVFRKIELLNKVTLAAINGYCLGGGCELAMSCDMRIASKKAKFGQPEVSLGIIPGFSGTQRLSRLVGLAKAKELVFTGKMIDANEALEIGLVNQVSLPEQLMTDVEELTDKILNNSHNAIINAKKAMTEGIEAPMEDAIELENIYFSRCFSDEDQKEGMRAFLEKRKANFK